MWTFVRRSLIVVLTVVLGYIAAFLPLHANANEVEEGCPKCHPSNCPTNVKLSWERNVKVLTCVEYDNYETPSHYGNTSGAMHKYLLESDEPGSEGHCLLLDCDHAVPTKEECKDPYIPPTGP